MEQADYYKLKAELTEVLGKQLKDTIAEERDLQQRYIGVGLKVAAAGAAAVFVSLGFLGIKSSYDINSAIADTTKRIEAKINEDITNKFADNSPVKRYQDLLLRASARAIVASFQLQASRGGLLTVQLDEHSVEAINAALRSPEIHSNLKRQIIVSLTSSGIRARDLGPATDSIVVDLLREAVDKMDKLDDMAIACIRYLGNRNAAANVAIVERAYAKHNSDRSVRLAVAEYASQLERDEGERLVNALDQTSDSETKFLVHMRKLRVQTNVVVDPKLIDSVLPFGRSADDRPRLSLNQTLSQISELADSAGKEMLALQILDHMREVAKKNNHQFGIGRRPFDDSETYGFADGRTTFLLSHNTFNETVQSGISLAFARLAETKGPISNEDIERIAFWLPKNLTRRGQARADQPFGWIAVSPDDSMTFVTDKGERLERSQLTGRVTMTIPRIQGKSVLQLNWRDAGGTFKSANLASIEGIDETNFSAAGPWKKTANDSDDD